MRLAMLRAASALAVPFVITSISGDRDAKISAVLYKDDACQLRDGEASAGCALQALQTVQGRGGGPAPVESQQVPKADPDAEDQEWYYMDGDRDKEDFLAKLIPSKVKNATGKLFNEMPTCKIWLAYFWPQLSFWSAQVGRRLRAVSFDDEVGLAKVRKFAYQASYLACIMKMDPRKGHGWSEHVQKFFKQVAESDDLDMPALPTFFRLTSNRDSTFVSSPNMFFFASLACDIDWWAQDMTQGQSHGKELCWDEVKHPGWGFSIGGTSILRDEPAWPPEYDPLVNPEFEKCQDHDLNGTLFDGICPFGGHVRNMYGVDSWGTGVPKHERKTVLECQRKMGPVQYFNVTSPMDMKYYFMDGIDLGPMVMDGDPPRKMWDGGVNEKSRAKYFQETLWHFLHAAATS